VQCVYTLVIKNDLGLAQLDLKMHAFFTCKNIVLQLILLPQTVWAERQKENFYHNIIQEEN
jgi:hypothetical protein